MRGLALVYIWRGERMGGHCGAAQWARAHVVGRLSRCSVFVSVSDNVSFVVMDVDQPAKTAITISVHYYYNMMLEEW